MRANYKTGRQSDGKMSRIWERIKERLGFGRKAEGDKEDDRVMYIIAGLGNPTREYEKTRHNVGFEVIDVLADRLGRPRIMTIAFAIMAVGTFAIALFPKMSVPVFVALCALVYVGMYCNYGIVFSLMDDGGIPMEVSGTAVGVICTIGYLPEVVCPATAGIILDTFTEAGYKYYFLAVGIIMLIGIVGIMIWNRSMKKQKALNK